MIVYISNNQISEKILSIYEKQKERPYITDVLNQLLEEGCYSTESQNHPLADWIQSQPHSDFPSNCGQLCWEIDTDKLTKKVVHQVGDPGLSIGFPSHVFMNSIFYKEKTDLHLEEDYFECNYIYQGTCDLYFEQQRRELKSGDLCVIPPKAMHNVRICTKDSFLIQLFLNYRTFNHAFLSLLSDHNILSSFFRAILLNKEHANYLLISTGESSDIRRLARSLYLEYFRYDKYAPPCTADWTRLLFSHILRNAERSYAFASPSDRLDLDLGPVMKYLNTNYHFATLGDTAKRFHYSPSYLSIMIKKLTGKTFTSLIRELKMNDALHYLETTKKSVEEIATLTGYNSADQFTKVFRATYQTTPRQYRKNHQGKKE